MLFVGGMIKDDMKIGCVVGFFFGELLQCMIFIKVVIIFMVFDYIQCVMFWMVLKLLKLDEVYVIFVYMLNLLEMVLVDFVLFDKNIVDVQKLLFNCNGMMIEYGLWLGVLVVKGGIGNGGKLDVKNVVCMKNCKKEVQIGLMLLDYVCMVYGEFYDQNCSFGLVCGMKMLDGEVVVVLVVVLFVMDLVIKNGCMVCYGVNNKIVGLGYNEVQVCYKDQVDVEV